MTLADEDADSILANNASCNVVADADAILRVPNVEDSAKDLQLCHQRHNVFLREEKVTP